MPDYNKYFDNFPIIEYANTNAIDILARVKILDSVYKNPFVYYPYQVPDGDRPDKIAFNYYNDSYMSWLVYHANKVVDPYHDWPLTYEQFNKFIIEKYGSIAEAQYKTKFYRVSWADDDQSLPQSYYENTLAESGKKYFTGQYATNGKVLSYVRKELDWAVNTNFILKLDTTMSGKFTNDSVLFVTTKVGNTLIGTCEVVSQSNSSSIIVQHVSLEHEDFQLDIDTFSEHSANSFKLYEYGTTKSANLESYTILSRNIPNDEIVYWGRVSLYDYENEKNEQRKSVYLLDSSFASQAVQELKKTLGN